MSIFDIFDEFDVGPRSVGRTIGRGATRSVFGLDDDEERPEGGTDQADLVAADRPAIGGGGVPAGRASAGGLGGDGDLVSGMMDYLDQFAAEGDPTSFIGLRDEAPQTLRDRARYALGAELEPATWSPERIARLQRDLDEAGLLDMPYQPGRWGTGDEIEAYERVLALANINSTTASDIISGYKANPAMAKDKPTFQPKQYMVPDLDSIEQTVRSEVQSTVGTANLSDDVYDELAMRLSSHYRDMVTQRQQLDRAEYDRAIAAEQGGDVPGQLDPVEEIDPLARFRSDLEERFAGSIRRGEDQETYQAERGLFNSSANLLAGMIGGPTA